MKKIEPGQVWVDGGDGEECRWDGGYKGEMVYVVCSQMVDEPWLCLCFQEWTMGAYTREFNAKELNEMKFVGNLKDLKDIRYMCSVCCEVKSTKGAFEDGICHECIELMEDSLPREM